MEENNINKSKDENLGIDEVLRSADFTKTPKEYSELRMEQMRSDIEDEKKRIDNLKEKVNEVTKPMAPTKYSFIDFVFLFILIFKVVSIPLFIALFVIELLLYLLRVGFIYNTEFIVIMKWNGIICLSINLIIIFISALDEFNPKNWEERMSTYRKQRESFDQLVNEYDTASKNFNKKILTIDEHAVRDCKIYKGKYEDYIRELSIDLSESKLIVKITEWLTEEFCKMINSVDRSDSIREIKIPFIFFVYSHKICCSTGEFNFEVERYTKLDSREKVIAVSKVIATQVQLNIISQFPKDISGTDVKVYIETKERNGDFNTNVSVNIEQWAYRAESCITYEAINGYFREEQDWL